MSLTGTIQTLKNELLAEKIEPEKGLGTELFLFASTLMPVVNVDLIVINKDRQILLSWRDDPHTGKGWHIPGSCVRFKECLDAAIQRCAKDELGTFVQYEKQPFEVFQFIANKKRPIDDQRERAHFITLSYKCHVPDDFRIDNRNKQVTEPGYLKWFNTLPEDLFQGHECYRTVWERIIGSEDKKLNVEQ